MPKYLVSFTNIEVINNEPTKGDPHPNLNLCLEITSNTRRDAVKYAAEMYKRVYCQGEDGTPVEDIVDGYDMRVDQTIDKVDREWEAVTFYDQGDGHIIHCYAVRITREVQCAVDITA